MVDIQALEQEKKVLIEELGVLMEKNHQLAPVAARIMSTLILTGKKGVTFDQLVQGLVASKSTVSNHLEHLRTGKKIQYFTKPGDRKRYFIVNPNLMIEVIDQTVQAWEAEKRVQEKILHYKRNRNQLDPELEPPFDLDFQKNLLIFLDEATAAIIKLKKHIANKDC